MDAFHVVLVPLQFAGEVVHLAFGPAEYHHLGVSVLDQVHELVPLGVAVGHDVELFREVQGGLVLGDQDLPVVVHVLDSHLHDFFGHGGREHHGLSVLGDPGEDHVHAGGESHVQHAVGLVKDDDLDGVELDHLPLDEVLESSGGGNHCICPFLKLFRLGLDVNAAVDGDADMPAVFRESFHFLGHLRSELPCRHENQ